MTFEFKSYSELFAAQIYPQSLPKVYWTAMIPFSAVPPSTSKTTHTHKTIKLVVSSFLNNDVGCTPKPRIF